jgi:multidrug efflux pump subunit AcrB
VPQRFLHIDRDMVLKQNVDLGSVYQTLQTFMGSYFVNYFNRFGRQWQVFVQAEGDYRTNIDQVGQFFVKNKNGDILGCVPLARASGAGALSRQVMGYVVIGGMLAASFIAIFLIPVLFYLVERISGKKPQLKEPAPPPPAPAATAAH